MKRLNWIVLTFSLVTLTTFGLLNSWKVGAKAVRVNVRDLSEHNLFLVAPTDPSFDARRAKLGVTTEESLTHPADAIRPFSVIVRNQGSRDVIAYRLRWDVIQADGRLTTHLVTYAEPDALMGGSSSHPPNTGAAIGVDSDRYVSYAGAMANSHTSGLSMGAGSGASMSELGAIQEIGAQRNQTALLGVLENALATSQSLTVTLDVAIFDDGSFVGPDSFNYFDQIKAEIDAKQDLLREALSDAQHNRPLGKVFKNAESLASEADVSLRHDSSQADYYGFYKQEFAKELLRMRANSRDDKTAVWLATRPLYRDWPKLHKEQ